MDYERKYKEALNWMKDVYPTLKGAAKEDAEHYFPELKESEDERIRKVIKQVLYESTTEKDECYLDNGVTQQEVFAWLEKQGEQKLYVNDNAKEMFIKALERVEEQNNKGYKLTDCDKNSWWEDFKDYSLCTIKQNQAWSEEDEKLFGLLHTCVCRCITDPYWDYEKRENISKNIPPFLDKLKTLRPQTNWKPSEEQIDNK